MLPSELLADQAKWAQFAFARDENGDDVSPLSARARSWCLLGAADRCGVAMGDFADAVKVVVRRDADAFNDDPATTHADVIRVLKEAGY